MQTFHQPTTLVPLTPGSYEGFAVLPGIRQGTLESFYWYTRDALFTHNPPTPAPSTSPLLGAWHDKRTDTTQYLKPDGRYSETRQGRENAYEGHFWIAGNHIVYRDDLDFWAYALLQNDILIHADFRFRRS